MDNDKKPTGIKARGFASLSPERRREMASLGGKSVDPANRTFSRDKELAKAAGTKGGLSLSDEKRTFSRDHDIAAAAGRIGGLASPKVKRGPSAKPRAK
jgi:uncharacterized protein